mmetsp:Transcript_39912/g.104645  ORF Transcript_39912/g.104645 Transcript_39912/m.104645 type:complete len:244 (+) Transcript_39912:1460-2191(+)
MLHTRRASLLWRCPGVSPLAGADRLVFSSSVCFRGTVLPRRERRLRTVRRLRFRGLRGCLCGWGLVLFLLQLSKDILLLQLLRLPRHPLLLLLVLPLRLELSLQHRLMTRATPRATRSLVLRPFIRLDYSFLRHMSPPIVLDGLTCLRGTRTRCPALGSSLRQRPWRRLRGRGRCRSLLLLSSCRCSRVPRVNAARRPRRGAGRCSGWGRRWCRVFPHHVPRVASGRLGVGPRLLGGCLWWPG